MLQDTHNFWTKDLARNEDNYERQEVISLEDERIELIA